MRRLLIAALLIAGGSTAQTVVTVTTAGSSTWTAPAGVVSIKVECWGGGGGGATMTSSGGGGGGGGGAYAARLTMAVTPGVIYSYTVGAAGATNGGGNGGATTFTGDSSVQCVAAGGASVATNSATGGAGGLVASSTGDAAHVFAGGAGANGVAGSYGGGGGASGGSAANGNSATNATGATAVTGGGPGGGGKSSPQGAGNAPAGGPGGGGGGGLRTSSGTRSGGAGFAGQIKITYNTLTASVAEPQNVLASATAGQYTNNSAKSASVVENIQYVSAEQNRWNFGVSQVNSGSDLGGRGLRSTVSETLTPKEDVEITRPAKAFATSVADAVPYVPSEQTRVGIAQSFPSLLGETSTGNLQGLMHFTVSVIESIPYVPATHFDWSAGPAADGMLSQEAQSQSYVPGIPAVTAVPRRPIVIR